MQESYSGSNRRIKLSSREIRKMKENMKKVPEIQKKAESYHRFEDFSSFIQDTLHFQLSKHELFPLPFLLTLFSARIFQPHIAFP